MSCRMGASTGGGRRRGHRGGSDSGRRPGRLARGLADWSVYSLVPTRNQQAHIFIHDSHCRLETSTKKYYTSIQDHLSHILCFNLQLRFDYGPNSD